RSGGPSRQLFLNWLRGASDMQCRTPVCQSTSDPGTVAIHEEWHSRDPCRRYTVTGPALRHKKRAGAPSVANVVASIAPFRKGGEAVLTDSDSLAPGKRK